VRTADLNAVSELFLYCGRYFFPLFCVFEEDLTFCDFPLLISRVASVGHVLCVSLLCWHNCLVMKCSIADALTDIRLLLDLSYSRYENTNIAENH
jgi:hypothetical protein